MATRTIIRQKRDIAAKDFQREVTPEEPPHRWWMESWTGHGDRGPYTAVVICDEPHRWGADPRYRQPERPHWPNTGSTGVGNVRDWLRAVWEEQNLIERPGKRKR